MDNKMIENHFKPPMIVAAEQNIVQSIQPFLLFPFDFSEEGPKCIYPLKRALEWLLKRIYLTEGKRPEKYKPYYIARDYWAWDDNQKKTAIKFFDFRNDLEHSGAFDGYDKEEVEGIVREIYVLVGEIYTRLGYSLDEVFSTIEQKVLTGQELNWKEKASVWSRAALDYLEKDPESAIQISNDAFDLAFRGFAKSWRIEDADTLTIPELIRILEKYEYYYDSEYYQEDSDVYSSPYYLAPYEDGGVEERYIGVGFYPPMNSNEIMDISLAKTYGSVYAFKWYVEEVNKAVSSYIVRSPYLDLYACLLDNWDYLVEEVKLQYPE